MKKIITIIISIGFLGISGCKKGLDAQLPGTLNPTTFPKTEADYQALVTGVYKLFGSKWSYSDGGITGDLFFGVEFSNIFLNDYPTDGIAYFPEWGGFFDSFSKADFNFMRNLDGRRNHLEKIRFITKIAQIIVDVNASSVVTADAKITFEAEARAARGILMYYLLTMYGPVPYIDDPAHIGNSEIEANMARPDRSKYVMRVAEDLQFAADNLLPSPADYGRFNKGCALTYLMRLYLFEKDWSNAEKAGRELLNMNYQLVEDYPSLFKVATEKNPETIWAISCDPAANGNNNLGNMNAWTFYTYSADYPGNISAPGESRKGGWASPAGAFTATWYFYDTFHPSDERRALLIPSYSPVNSSGSPTGAVNNRENGLRGPVINKYPDDDPTAFAGNDIPVCRYADVLLMMAEIINEQQGPVAEAQGFINQVRNRANLPDLEGLDIASKEAFRDAILRERGWELFFEGQRRIDLVRMGKFSEILAAAGKTPQPGSGLFPVPQYMLDRGMEQTPGY